MKHFVFFFLLIFKSFAMVPENCRENHKKFENIVLERMNISAQKWNIQEIILGSYANDDYFHSCQHHFLIYYERYMEDYFRAPKSYIRHFSFDNSGEIQGPTEPLQTDRPIENTPFKTGPVISPSYGCEQSYEFAYVVALELVRDFPTYSNPYVSTLVLGRDKYPFCDYQVFTMSYKDKNEDINSELEFTHNRLNELGQWEFPQKRIIFPGKRIDLSIPI